MTAKSDLQHEHTDSSPTEGRTESLSPGKHANVPVQDATGAWQAEPIASAGDTLLTVDVPASVREETSGATIDAPAGRAAPMAEDTFGATIDAPASRPPSSGETPFGATTDIPADCAPPAVADTFGATIDAPAERPFPSPDTFGATVDAPATRTGSPRPAEEPPPAGSAPGTHHRRIDATGTPSPGAYPAVAPEMRSGRYLLKKFHAKGGMGEIWLAEDCDIGRPVALKKMRGKPSGDQQDQFLREAQITGQMEHPGVVPIHELGTDENGKPFYVMKFIQGRTLSEIVAEYHAPPIVARSGDRVTTGGDPATTGSREVQGMRLLQFFLNLGQTVAYAHSKGVIHRDLKPDNVMVGDYGETLLLDWGLAKPLGQPDEPGTPGYIRFSYSGESLETQDGSIKGTPTYMSPEVAEGRIADVDRVSDVYLLGGILYHILTGKRLREATKVSELIRLARTVPPVPPRKLVPTISKALDAICTKALALRKEDRYQTAQELAEDVQRYLAGEPVLAYRENLWERAWRWVKRHRVALARVALLVLVLGVFAFGVAKVREAEAEREAADEAKQKAQREAAELQRQKQARADVEAFRRLADEAQHYAAFQDPGSEHVPYFDLEKGENKAMAALALVQPWGPWLEELPLAEERAPLRAEIYDLLLLTARTKSRRAGQPATVREMFTLLDRAAAVREPTVSYYHLRADAYRLGGDKVSAAADRRKAEDAGTPAIAIDHFLAAEEARTEHVRQASGPGKETGTAKREQLTRAIELYRKALALQQKHFWSHFQLGHCYLALGQGDMAVEALGACVALRPDSPLGYNMRGLVLGLQKRYPEVRTDLGRAIALDGNFRPARLNRGLVNWLQKKYDAALADFEAVLQPPAEQRLLEAAFYRGQLHLERREEDKALADFTLAVSEKRGVHAAYLRRARIYFARGDMKRGLSDIDAYLQSSRSLDPKSAEGLEQRGRQLRLLAGELPKDARKIVRGLALADLRKAVDLHRRTMPLYDNLGAVLEDLGQVPAAITAYTEAIKYSPEEARLLVKRGWAHEKLQQFNEALADFTAALQLEPTHAEAHAGVGYIQACRGQAPGAASRHASEAVLHGSGDYLLLYNVACVYGKLSERDPKRARAYQDLALLYLRRVVELWRRDRQGPSPIPLIRSDPAFPPPLRERPEFDKLLREPQ